MSLAKQPEIIHDGPFDESMVGFDRVCINIKCVLCPYCAILSSLFSFACIDRLACQAWKELFSKEGACCAKFNVRRILQRASPGSLLLCFCWNSFHTVARWRELPKATTAFARLASYLHSDRLSYPCCQAYHGYECRLICLFACFLRVQLTNTYLVYWADKTAYLDPAKEPKGCINLKRVRIWLIEKHTSPFSVCVAFILFTCVFCEDAIVEYIYIYIYSMHANRINA